MDNKKILQISFLVVIVAALIIILPRLKTHQAQVTDFSSCQQAGGIVADGEPVTCSIHGKTFDEAESLQPEVMIDTPQAGAVVKSPLTVSGKARGNWFFEAQLPVILKDDQGNILAQTPGHAIGDWMTTDFVPFSADLKFIPGNATQGALIIKKDNPSGDPQFDSAFAVPVRFK